MSIKGYELGAFNIAGNARVPAIKDLIMRLENERRYRPEGRYPGAFSDVDALIFFLNKYRSLNLIRVSFFEFLEKLNITVNEEENI